MDGLDLTVYWLDTERCHPASSCAAWPTGTPSRFIAFLFVRRCVSPRVADRDKEIAALHKWVDVADKLGASHIRVFGGKVPAGVSTDQAAHWVTEILKIGSEYASSKGVILGLENHGGITEKADTIIKIVKAVDSPWVGINLDTGNFNRNAYQQIEQCLPYAVNSQFKVDDPS